jgi:hypothetical protein
MVPRLIRVIAVVGVTVGCSRAQQATPAPTPMSSVAEAPAEAGGFRRVNRETLPDGGGTLFRFRDSSSAYLTVILYPTDSAARRAYPTPASLLRYEGAKFVQVMDIQVRRGLYRNYRLLASRPDSVPVVPTLAPGHTSVASAVLRGRPVVEYQRLFLVDTTFIKVRATIPEADWPRPDLDDVTRTILASLVGRSGD